MPVIHRGSHEIHYEVKGKEGAPPVLLVMGLGMPARAWGTLPEVLSETYRVIVLDNLGTGNSTLPDRNIHVADMADDAAAVLDAAGIPRAAVFGVSMGGMITIELVLRHPAKVQALVLGCTHGGYLTSKKPSVHTTLSLMRSTMSRKLDLGRTAGFLVSDRYFKDHEKEFHDWLKLAGRPNPRTILTQMFAIARYEASKRLATIKVPTLVITGDADKLVPADNSRRLAARIPGAKLVLLPGVGHAFRLEAEAESAQEIGAFLAEVLATGSP
jgi:pimeloyl-ACP methyl ester carboxylesterase